MKTNRANPSKMIPFSRCELTRLLLVGVACILALAAPRRASAETHAVIPNVTINSSTKSITVDSVNHWVFSVNPSNQVQVTYLNKNVWTTVALGAGQPVKPNTQIYVDSNWHALHYVGANTYLWCWYLNPTTWQNTQLHPWDPAVDLVGVDSGFHMVWYLGSASLTAIYYDGTAWTRLPTFVNADNTIFGGAVDNASHSVFWVDSSTYALRSLCYSGRAFVSSAIASGADPPSRPAVHQGNGAVYYSDQNGHHLNRRRPDFIYAVESVGGVDDANYGYATIAVNPNNGKVIFNREIAGPTGEIAVLTPSSQGANPTWTRSSVSGTSGQGVRHCALDTSNGWYFYTTGDNALHIVY